MRHSAGIQEMLLSNPKLCVSEAAATLVNALNFGTIIMRKPPESVIQVAGTFGSHVRNMLHRHVSGPVKRRTEHDSTPGVAALVKPWGRMANPYTANKGQRVPSGVNVDK